MGRESRVDQVRNLRVGKVRADWARRFRWRTFV